MVTYPYYLITRTLKVIIVLFISIIFSTSLSKAHADELIIKDDAMATASADMTIFRTVNTLSCHPQNPLLNEVPHYVMLAPNKSYFDANGVKGACWAYHNEGNTNFVS